MSIYPALLRSEHEFEKLLKTVAEVNEMPVYAAAGK